MIDKVKKDLFTISAIIVTIIHICFVVGIGTCWIAFQTQVLGNDPLSASPRSIGKSGGK